MSSTFEFKLYVLNDEAETEQMASELLAVLKELYGDSTFLTKKNLFHNDNAIEAQEDGVFSVPALIRTSPEPFKHIIGDLSDSEAILMVLSKSGSD